MSSTPPRAGIASRDLPIHTVGLLPSADTVAVDNLLLCFARFMQRDYVIVAAHPHHLLTLGCPEDESASYSSWYMYRVQYDESFLCADKKTMSEPKFIAI